MADIRNSIRNTSATFSSEDRKTNILLSLALTACTLAVLYVVLSRMEYPWNWRVPWTYRSLYVQGFYSTIMISAGAICLGFILGLGGGLARVSDNTFAREASRIYVIFFRGTPLLIQIYIFYFCLAAAIHFDNPVVIGIVALAAFSGA
jgi:polar amino acid transport system permease protein